MLFRSYKPIPPLCHFIQSLWIYNGFESPRLKERIFPSGTVEIVFNLRDDELRIYKPAQPDRYRRLSGAIVSGPYKGFFVADTEEEASVMGVHFKPGGAFPFLGFPADELADMHVNLEEIWGQEAARIRECLSATALPLCQFQLLEDSLISSVLRPLEHHPAVSMSLDGFHAGGPDAVVRNLARNAGLSERRFIDIFRSEVGLNPKLFHRVQRFQRVLTQVHRVPAPDWVQVALDHGYYDQSHLIRDFLAFSGFSPADYLRGLHVLRAKGLQVKFNHLPVGDQLHFFPIQA